jgi:hypothetical protein
MWGNKHKLVRGKFYDSNNPVFYYENQTTMGESSSKIINSSSKIVIVEPGIVFSKELVGIVLSYKKLIDALGRIRLNAIFDSGNWTPTTESAKTTKYYDVVNTMGKGGLDYSPLIYGLETFSPKELSSILNEIKTHKTIYFEDLGYVSRSIFYYFIGVVHARNHKYVDVIRQINKLQAEEGDDELIEENEEVKIDKLSCYTLEHKLLETDVTEKNLDYYSLSLITLPRLNKRLEEYGTTLVIFSAEMSTFYLTDLDSLLEVSEERTIDCLKALENELSESEDKVEQDLYNYLKGNNTTIDIPVLQKCLTSEDIKSLSRASCKKAPFASVIKVKRSQEVFDCCSNYKGCLSEIFSTLVNDVPRKLPSKDLKIFFNYLVDTTNLTINVTNEGKYEIDFTYDFLHQIEPIVLSIYSSIKGNNLLRDHTSIPFTDEAKLIVGLFCINRRMWVAGHVGVGKTYNILSALPSIQVLPEYIVYVYYKHALPSLEEELDIHGLKHNIVREGVLHKNKINLICATKNSDSIILPDIYLAIIENSEQISAEKPLSENILGNSVMSVCSATFNREGMSSEISKMTISKTNFALLRIAAPKATRRRMAPVRDCVDDDPLAKLCNSVARYVTEKMSQTGIVIVINNDEKIDYMRQLLCDKYQISPASIFAMKSIPTEGAESFNKSYHGSVKYLIIHSCYRYGYNANRFKRLINLSNIDCRGIIMRHDNDDDVKFIDAIPK